MWMARRCVFFWFSASHRSLWRFNYLTKWFSSFSWLQIKHGSDYQTDYYPDLITNDSISFLRESKQNYDHQPFLMVMSFPSPHGPEDSAPQYSNMFFNVTRHRTPSYDFAPNPDKQWILRWLGKMKPIHHKFTDMLMTKRLQTLQSVDEAVEKVFSELVALNQLDNTYIFYTSDHGYHLGQFGLIKGEWLLILFPPPWVKMLVNCYLST